MQQPQEAPDHFLLTLSLAVLIHAVLLLGIQFSRHINHESQTLEITLVAHKSNTAPENPDFLAQANQAGSGSLTEKAEVTTTQLADFNDNEIHTIQSPAFRSAAQNSAEKETPAVLTSQAARTSTIPAKPFLAPSPDNSDIPESPSLQTSIEERALEIASLQAQLRTKEQAYAKRPRKQQLTAMSAQADSSAAYLNSWRDQIETVGNKNYPALNIENLYGSLRLMVAVNANGSLAEVRLLKSSGHAKLDRAAMQIVRQAAPFAPFPETIRRTTDILEIIRTWKFEQGRYSL